MKFWLHTITLIAVALATSVQAAPLSQEPDRVMYQIYVETFKDGSTNRAGSGNFDGIKQSLGYLKDLGVTSLLLMPIFASDGMGYIPDDFFSIRGDYALADSPQDRETNFKIFAQAAHEQGIKIILDCPINHISSGSEWFRNSSHRQWGMDDWFLWSSQPQQGWRRPWQPDGTPADVWHWSQDRGQFYYGLFSDGMPDLNHTNPRVIETFNAFFAKYAELGADGFRIDAARHLVEGKTNTNNVEPANLARLHDYLSVLRSRFRDQSFVLEIWAGHGDIDPYLPDSGDIALDFPFMENIRNSLQYNHPYGIRNTLKEIADTQDSIGPGSRVIFMGNHDVPRIRTFNNDNLPKTELSMALTLSLPQIPLIYYGDEIFMPGNYTRDNAGATKTNEVCTPMAWTPGPNAGFTDPSIRLRGWNRTLHRDYQANNVESQSRNPDSLINTVKQLLHARKALPINPRTRLRVDKHDDSDAVLKTAMIFNDGTCTVGLYNFSTGVQNRPASFYGSCNVTPGSQALAGKRFTARGDSIELEAAGFVLLKGQTAR